jgi:hypothetical protein
MAKVVNLGGSSLHRIKKVTSIGKSVRSRPKNKSAKRGWKKYRGQG